MSINIEDSYFLANGLCYVPKLRLLLVGPSQARQIMLHYGSLDDPETWRRWVAFQAPRNNWPPIDYTVELGPLDVLSIADDGRGS